jgi:TolB-like protein
MIQRVSLILCIGLILSPPVRAGELERKLERIASTFETNLKEPTPTIAVLPFTTDSKLAKKRVDFAVSELLTERFLRGEKFKVVERGGLDKVLREQMLGLTGAVAEQSAAKIGQLAGASRVVLGSVVRLGDSYQISARLVNSSSGDVETAAVVEVPVSTFDEEASRFLVLVPESQAIGIYAVGAWLPIHTKVLQPGTFDVGSGPVGFTPSMAHSAVAAAGVGIRYSPTRKTMIDVSYITTPNGIQLVKLDNLPPGYDYVNPINFDLNAFRGSLNWVADLRRSVKGIIGAGWWTASLKTNSAIGIGHPKFNSAFVRTGLEYRIQERIGVSILGDWNLWTDTLNWPNNVGPTSWTFETPRFTVESAVALYF